jgi:DNA-binding NarL/FixJ family response regulator
MQSGEEALAFLEHSSADVLLLDLHMPGMSGVETLLALQKLTYPPKIIVLSSFEPDEEICRAVEGGAKAYLRKDTSCAEIIEAVLAVHSGSIYFPQWIIDLISERKLRPRLSPRELEILEMVSKGLTNKEIGHAIQVSHYTVRNHVRHIIAKLEAGDRTEAAMIGFQQGILTPHDSLPSVEGDRQTTGQPTSGSDSWSASGAVSRHRPGPQPTGASRLFRQSAGGRARHPVPKWTADSDPGFRATVPYQK